MINILLYSICGIIVGFCLGTTGLNITGSILILLNFLNIGDYKSNIGSLLVVNLFPLSIGSVYEFYLANKINYELAYTLIVTITLGSYLGSKLINYKKQTINNKTIKYFSATIATIIGIMFFISAYYDKDE
jgi:uncharacterized membrane protein YfcA